MIMSTQQPLREAIVSLSNCADRKLAWQFVIFFSRFEFALKQTPPYLKQDRFGGAQPYWDRYGLDHARQFQEDESAELESAIIYFKTSPPCRQLASKAGIDWSPPQKYDEAKPLLCWLLNVVKIVRNNLFHGGKYPLKPVTDPSRNVDLIANAIVVLDAALKLDANVRSAFEDEMFT